MLQHKILATHTGIPLWAIICIVEQRADACKVEKTKIFFVRQPDVDKLLVNLFVLFSERS